MTAGIDAPAGWEHKDGYHLNGDGKSIEFLADARYRAIVEAMHEPEAPNGLAYYVVVFERSSEGQEAVVDGFEHDIYHDKGEALEALEYAMRDLQTTITAPVEYHDAAGEVSGIDHDGARYCLDCAREHDDIDVERYIKEPRSVAYGGPVTIDSETEIRYHCGRCHREIEMTLIGEARRDPTA